jgi:mannose-1-phosphate guanylyltransferase
MDRDAWAIVLAAGEGRRLASVTRDASGRVVPKQYFHLGGGPTLLERTMARARKIVAPERIVTIVASSHREWWEGGVDGIPSDRIVVQPSNRGTAVGIMLSLVHVLRRDPDAIVIVLPSDHFVEDEPTLVAAVKTAIQEVRDHPDELLLLGITADHPDTEYGWVTPGEPDDSGVFAVSAFIEKPAAELAERLHRDGALWNSFMFVAVGKVLLEVCSRRLPDVLAGLTRALDDGGTLETFYASLETHDFSREILQTFPAHLRLMRVPACGWTDLGTPARFASVHERAGR